MRGCLPTNEDAPDNSISFWYGWDVVGVVDFGVSEEERKEWVHTHAAHARPRSLSLIQPYSYEQKFGKSWPPAVEMKTGDILVI